MHLSKAGAKLLFQLYALVLGPEFYSVSNDQMVSHSSVLFST
jgi:hypothetical protein